MEIFQSAYEYNGTLFFPYSYLEKAIRVQDCNWNTDNVDINHLTPGVH